MENLSKLRIKRNYLLVKPDMDHEKVNLKNSEGQKFGELYIESTNETEARHYAITGTVLAIPEQLTYRGRSVDELRKRTGSNFTTDEIKELQELVKESMEIDVEQELRVGDKVWFEYIAQLNGETQKLKVEIEGHGTCLLMRYDKIFLYERDLKIFPINGWIFIKDLEGNRDLGNGLMLPDTIDVTPRGVGEVVRVSSPVRHYMEARHNCGRVDAKPGMKVRYRPNAWSPAEYSLHETLGLEGLKKIQQKDIIAIEMD